MSYMFDGTGGNSQVFTLDLREKFDTSNVTDMNHMFNGAGRNSQEFTLDLGEKFDTSNVTDMSYMFSDMKVKTIYISKNFDISSVSNSKDMFLNAKFLVGGQGTVYNYDASIDATYARIDGLDGLPGYFTEKVYNT